MPLYPLTRDHAHQLLDVAGIIVFVDATMPLDTSKDPKKEADRATKVCVGFTEGELRQGLPAVRISSKGGVDE
jgi:hypothetical protein